MKISILIPTLNVGDSIAKAVDSVVSQGAECVVLDALSTDGTAEIARQHGAVVYEGKDSGMYEALNKGVHLATGEVLGWVGGDDWLLPGSIERVAQNMADGTKWMYGQCEIWKNGRIDHIAGMGLATQEEESSANRIPAPAVFYRKDFVEEMGMFDETLKLAGDYEMWLRFYTRANPKYVPVRLAAFGITGKNRSEVDPRIHVEDRAIKEKYAYLRNHIS